jgi:hypothetical protein
VLAQAQALALRQREVARSAAAAKRAQAAIEYGDPSGVQGLDEQTIAAARDNPFSVLRNLERDYQTGVRDLEENLNAANLFYSGYRGTKLGEAATDYQSRRASAASAFQGLLADVENALAQALLQADWAEAAALQDAYARALQQALEYGYGYPGQPGDGGRALGIRDAALALVGADRSAGAGRTVRGVPTDIYNARRNAAGFGGGLAAAMIGRRRRY